MPGVNLPPVDDEAERREIAGRFGEYRVIAQGREALAAITRSASFENYCSIGKALLVGKKFALHTSGANCAMGRTYSLAFSRWIREHKFESMPKSLRSVCIELAENAEAITAWRNGLPERQRRRLVSPLAVTRRWKAATGQYQAQRSRDLKWDAQTAWRKFCACLQSLPPSESTPLWREVQSHAATMLEAA